MIGMSGKYLSRSIHLFEQHDTGHFVRPCEITQAKQKTGFFTGFREQSVRPADNELEVVKAVILFLLQKIGEFNAFKLSR